MPFIALLGALLNLVRSAVQGGMADTPALRPIPIDDRQRSGRRR